MEEIKLDDVLGDIYKRIEGNKSIVISNLLQEAIFKRLECIPSYDEQTLFGLPYRTSRDLNFAEYQLLKFDIRKIA